jgi:hypothetical protein
MEVIGTAAVVLSVLVLAYQARELARNTRVANEVAGTHAHQELLIQYKSLMDVFIRYPELHGYFFDKTSATPSPGDSVRLDVLADTYADWLALTLMTSERLASYADWTAEWTSFAPQAVASSARLRAVVRDNPGVYPQLDPFVASYDASGDRGVGRVPTA